MKKFLFFIILITIHICSIAQNNEGITFNHGTLAEVKEKAKKDKKLIFIDCYTSWCGPCKRLSSEIFTQKEIGDFFNQHFISVKIDCEKGEGIDLAKTYHVGAYPSLLWIDSKDRLVHRVVGFRTAEQLMSEAKEALNGGNFNKELEKNYEKNKNDKETVKAFLDYLTQTADARSKTVAKQYLSLLSGNEYESADVFKLITNEANDPFSPAVEYIVNNKTTFIQKFGAEEVSRAFKNIYYRYSISLLKSVNPDNSIDEKALSAMQKQMEKIDFQTPGLYIERIRISTLKQQKDWASYTQKVDDLIKNADPESVTAKDVLDWFKPIVESDCTSPEVLESTIRWINLTFDKRITNTVDILIPLWQDKLTVLHRMTGKEKELNQTEIELNMLKVLQKKNEAFQEDLEKQKQRLKEMMGIKDTK